jgi:putative SOS response-associated peptidase YedK
MCGRFTLHTEREALARRFQVDLEGLEELGPRYNVAPTQSVLTVYERESGRKAALMRWGLVPHWTKDLSKLPSMINARVETVASRPAYRRAFRRRRCLILADGFYAWGPGERGTRERSPFWVSLAEGAPFAMAGLWAAWHPPDDPEGEPTLSCTILTVPANATVGRIHDRMPAILHPEAEASWLDPTIEEAETLEGILVPVPAEALRLTPVSRRVNSPRNDGPELIRSVPEPPTLGF